MAASASAGVCPHHKSQGVHSACTHTQLFWPPCVCDAHCTCKPVCACVCVTCSAQREEELRTYKAKLVDDKLLADSQDVADRQPVFLKDKGDALYRQANYRCGCVCACALCVLPCAVCCAPADMHVCVCWMVYAGVFVCVDVCASMKPCGMPAAAAAASRWQVPAPFRRQHTHAILACRAHP